MTSSASPQRPQQPQLQNAPNHNHSHGNNTDSSLEITPDEREVANIQSQIAQLLAKQKQLQTRIEFSKEESQNSGGSASETTLIVVANRLPVTLTKNKQTKKYEFKRSAGGLVTALAQLKNLNMKWVGCPDFIPREDRELVESELNRMGMYPLFADDKAEHDDYYNGFCNGIIWPLFHYITWTDEVVPRYNDYYNAYRKINYQFATLIDEISPKGAMVWIHDYHLLLCPSYLRRLRKNCIMGFFLHIPFPNYEQYRLLPTGANLLRGVLACNLVGFHTHDYAQHFRQTCAHQLQVELHPQSLINAGRMSIVSTFPIGTDPQKWRLGLKQYSVKEQILQLRSHHKDKKIILGIDRLDFIKGLPHKLYAFQRFLEKNPEYRQKIVFLQIAVPSRQNAPQYITLTRKCNELVGKINAKYASFASVPIHFLQQSFGFDELCALYHVADVCLVTSVRDGMNLVSYEYIACQDLNDPGVLVVSEFAGCAQSLASGAIVINPWDVEDTADGLKAALEMDVFQRRAAQELLYNIIRSNTVQHWAQEFMSSLKIAHEKCPIDAPVVPSRCSVYQISTGFRAARQRLILLGCGGTLVSTRKEHVRYSDYMRMTRIGARLKTALNILCKDEHTTVVIVSAGPRECLDNLIGDVNCLQFAENGYFMREGGCNADWSITTEYTDLSWKSAVLKTMRHFSERIPFTYIDEDLDSYISFRYKKTESESERKQISQMITALHEGPLSSSYSRLVHDRSGHIQVRQPGISKLSAFERVVLKIGSVKKIDYILCLADFLSFDEDVFVALNEKEIRSAVTAVTPQHHRRRRGSPSSCSGSGRSGASDHRTTTPRPMASLSSDDEGGPNSPLPHNNGADSKSDPPLPETGAQRPPAVLTSKSTDMDVHALNHSSTGDGDGDPNERRALISPSTASTSMVGMYPSADPAEMQYSSNKATSDGCCANNCIVMTVKVGRAETRAKHYIQSPSKVEDILVTLSEVITNRGRDGLMILKTLQNSRANVSVTNMAAYAQQYIQRMNQKQKTQKRSNSHSDESNHNNNNNNSFRNTHPIHDIRENTPDEYKRTPTAVSTAASTTELTTTTGVLVPKSNASTATASAEYIPGDVMGSTPTLAAVTNMRLMDDDDGNAHGHTHGSSTGLVGHDVVGNVETWNAHNTTNSSGNSNSNSNSSSSNSTSHNITTEPSSTDGNDADGDYSSQSTPIEKFRNMQDIEADVQQLQLEEQRPTVTKEEEQEPPQTSVDVVEQESEDNGNNLQMID